MRIWSLHPQYLDPQGLVALWREALLARKVLSGATRGYRHHPQLDRFRQGASPIALIDRYLHAVWEEAARRGYRFDAGKVGSVPPGGAGLEVTQGQMSYEWGHLTAKLAVRSPAWAARWATVTQPEGHPLFVVVAGEVAAWERR